MITFAFLIQTGLGRVKEEQVHYFRKTKFALESKRVK